MTQAGMEQAFEQVDAELADDDVLVVYLPDCHESLAGMIAGRVREAYNKPSFVLTRGEDCVKGSGRSARELPYVSGPVRRAGSAPEIWRPSHGSRLFFKGREYR